MTFVTQFNYFNKSIDSIFYSTPQIFEEISKRIGIHVLPQKN